MRIPITMCHGITEKGDKPLTVERFDSLMKIAHRLGFESINYDQLAAWRAGQGKLPDQPIMIDIDHPVKTIRYELKDVLDKYGFKANVFINTARMHPDSKQQRTDYKGTPCMTWEEIGQLHQAGWTIGAHTHNHPNLSQLSCIDPSGQKLLDELEACDSLIEEHIGIRPQDFAFTGTNWSSRAEQVVKQRYRFGRLWIVGSMYQADGKDIRYAELVGIDGADEADGGPPAAARYITEKSDPYRLASMELVALVYEDEAFERYLAGALQ